MTKPTPGDWVIYDFDRVPTPMPGLGALAFPDPSSSFAFLNVCLIECTFRSNATGALLRARGSGVLVGPNDILTATHVVARPGSTLVDIDVFVGHDAGNTVKYGAYVIDGSWTVDAFPIQQTADGRMDLTNSASDLALIGVSANLGLNYASMAVSNASPAWSDAAVILGYPGEQGREFTYSSGRTELDWAAYGSPFGNPLGDPALNIEGIYHAPGSSGGPIYNSAGYVIGVVSTSSYGARIDSDEMAVIREWAIANDHLLAVPAPQPTELASTQVNTFGGNDIVTADAAAVVVILGTNFLDRVTFTGSATLVLPDNIEDATLSGNHGASVSGNGLQNRLTGDDSANSLFGFDGNDILTGNGGNDRIAGDGGADTAVYGGRQADYRFEMNSSGEVVITDRRAGADGQDTVVDVEFFRFADGTLSMAELFAPSPLSVEPSPSTISTATSFALPDDVPNLVATGKGNVNLTGNALDNIIRGNAGRNVIKGGVGNDSIAGGLGNDVLTGGPGKDTFVFDAKPNRKSNVDKLLDFNVRDDRLLLDNKYFPKLGKGSEDRPMALKKTFFSLDGPADRNDYLNYNTKTGVLSYDEDGSGLKAAVEIAVLRKGLKMSHSDFLVI